MIDLSACAITVLGTCGIGCAGREYRLCTHNGQLFHFSSADPFSVKIAGEPSALVRFWNEKRYYDFDAAMAAADQLRRRMCNSQDVQIEIAEFRETLEKLVGNLDDDRTRSSWI